MPRPPHSPRPLLALALLAALAGAALLAFGGGEGKDDSGTALADEEALNELAEPAATEEIAAVRGLWSGDGHPIATVKGGARVRLHAERGGRAVAVAKARTIFRSPTAFAVQKRRGGWLRVTSSLTYSNDPVWIRADRDRLRYSETPLSIHVDLGARSVELREGERVLLRFPVTIGSEDSRTPPGHYAVTDVITKGLSPVYGCCALALSASQPDLPEEWIGGDLVAIHGSTGPVGSASSLGCIRGADEDVSSLARVVPLGTPVLISG